MEKKCRLYLYLHETFGDNISDQIWNYVFPIKKPCLIKSDDHPRFFIPDNIHRAFYNKKKHLFKSYAHFVNECCRGDYCRVRDDPDLIEIFENEDFFNRDEASIQKIFILDDYDYDLIHQGNREILYICFEKTFKNFAYFVLDSSRFTYVEKYILLKHKKREIEMVKKKERRPYIYYHE
jgi:hypothetical protein